MAESRRARGSDGGREAVASATSRVVEPYNGDVIPSLILALSLLTPIPRWETHGPPYPILDALVTAPTGTIYAASRGSLDGLSAVFRSVDGDHDWEMLAQAPSGETIRQIAIDPTGSERMLALTISDLDDVRVYRSNDGGETWRLTRTHLATTGTERIFFDPTQSDTAFFVSYGLLRAIDDGPWTEVGIAIGARSAWSSSDGGLFWTREFCYHIPCYPLDERFRSLFVSNDAGRTVVDETFDAPCLALESVAYADALTAYGAGLDCPDLLRSTDGGRTWESWDPSLDLRSLLHDGVERRIKQLVVDPRRPATLYVVATRVEGPGDGEILVSLDAGESWGDFDGPDGLSVTAVALDASDELVVGTTNGVFSFVNRTRLLPPR